MRGLRTSIAIRTRPAIPAAPPSRGGDPFAVAEHSAFTAVHVGDLHFWSLRMNPLALMGKRALGTANLVLRRARKFRRELAPVLLERIASLGPDWVLFSGDFTTTALDAEFRLASEALRGLVDACGTGRLLAVPGNHDRYTRAAITGQAFERRLHLGTPQPPLPSFHDLGDGVVLLRLDAGTPNGFGSFGRVHPPDLEVLGGWLGANGRGFTDLWVLCHFPMEDPPGPLHPDREEELRGAGPLLALLWSSGLRIVQLHGHHHHRWAYRSNKGSQVLYLNAGAPLMRRGGRPPDLGFHRLVRLNGGTRLEVHSWRESDGWSIRHVPDFPTMGHVVDLQGPDEIPASGP